ncbi:DUF1415 domain-containing protein [Pseudidiomarina homiensis]|uniref:DUF1415 domain-containing protein n=1 Tax=Pseudidiomarina homiensis TaxID=364198 RepID=UPI0018E59C2E|nr:DUF1415 domain-containing protein [Pseudidiomarina homiensis]
MEDLSRLSQGNPTASELTLACNAVRQWVAEVVVGLNFCPFAHREVEKNRVLYVDSSAQSIESALEDLASAMQQLLEDEQIETTLLVLSQGFHDFDDYLDLLDYAQITLRELNLEGTLQIASFHPHYQFADTADDDVSNYTNRAPFPVLHLLREASLEKVLARYPNPEAIPERNIEVAQQRGVIYFQALLERLRDNG